MNAEGSPSLCAQTVWVYSVRGLLESAVPDCSASSIQQIDAEKKRIRPAERKNRMSRACPILTLNRNCPAIWRISLGQKRSSRSRWTWMAKAENELQCAQKFHRNIFRQKKTFLKCAK